MWNRYKSCQNIRQHSYKNKYYKQLAGGEMLKIVDINILAGEGDDWLAWHKSQSNIQN